MLVAIPSEAFCMQGLEPFCWYVLVWDNVCGSSGITKSESMPTHQKNQCTRVKYTLRISQDKVRMSLCGPLNFIFLIYGRASMYYNIKICCCIFKVASTQSYQLNWICHSFGDWVWDWTESLSHLGMMQSIGTVSCRAGDALPCLYWLSMFCA